MGATPTAPATLLPQSPPVNPPVPSGPPFVCNYPPNTSPFSKPFGLQESFAGGTPEGLTKTPPETLISHYESVQATLKAGLESLGARPGANGGSTRVKRTAAELGVGEPSPVKRPKVADPVAAAEVGATEGVDANAEAREFEEVVPPAANVTETERNRVPAESGESGDRAEGEAVAAEPADSSAKVLSAEDAIPGSVSQSETEAENHRPRRRSFRQALFEEEHAVLNGLMRAAHDRGGPNRAPLPLPAVGQELRSRGLTVGGRFLRPSQVARQHPWFFDIHTKADPVGKEVPADVSLTQKGWEEAERMLQQEVAAKMTSAMVASPLVSSSRGGGVIVARPVVGSGGEGLEGSVAKEGPGGALDSFAEGLNDAHAVGERVSGEKANAPGLTEAKTATGVLARGKAEGRSEEEIWGKPKPKEPGTAPETREEIHDLAPETPASDLVPGGAVGQTGEECRDRVGSKETGIKHVGSADVAMR